MQPISKPFFAIALSLSAAAFSAGMFACPCSAEVTAPSGDEQEAQFDPTKSLRVKTVWPTMNEVNRPWVDRSGKHAVVAKLVGREGDQVIFLRADGKRALAHPDSLSPTDRAYAIERTEPRVNKTAQVLMGKIVSVRDGDTIQVLTLSNEKVTIRLDGIDAPEKRQDYGKTSTDWLARLTNRVVRVEFMEADRYQRILGQVYLGDRWVNYEMALAGMAWHYDRYNDDVRLSGAHAYAKSLTRGLWQQDEFIAPWDYRNGVRKKTLEPVNVDSIRDTDTVVYVTKSGHSYHCEDCHHVKKNGIPIPLSRAVSAYDCCEVCKPPTEHQPAQVTARPSQKPIE